MPIYEYDCAGCGRFELRRPMLQAREPANCPTCGALAARVISMPYLAVMNPHTRIAHARNEKSAHEPRVVPGQQLNETGRNMAHVGHEHTRAPLHKGLGPGWQHSNRRWMIGH